MLEFVDPRALVERGAQFFQRELDALQAQGRLALCRINVSASPAALPGLSRGPAALIASRWARVQGPPREVREEAWVVSEFGGKAWSMERLALRLAMARMGPDAFLRSQWEKALPKLLEADLAARLSIMTPGELAARREGQALRQASLEGASRPPAPSKKPRSL